MTPSPTPDSSPAPTVSPVPNLWRELWKTDGPSLQLTPGEYIDLLSVATVKYQKLADSDAPFDETRQALAQKALVRKALLELQSDHLADLVELYGLLMDYRRRLDVVHSELWDVEDKLRALDGLIHWQDPETKTMPRAWDRLLWHRLPDSFTDKLGEYVTLARRVYVLNTQRSEIKRELDERFGAAPEVKHYASF